MTSSFRSTIFVASRTEVCECGELWLLVGVCWLSKFVDIVWKFGTNGNCGFWVYGKKLLENGNWELEFEDYNLNFMG